MSTKKLGIALITLGLLGLAASILVDIIQDGEIKIQSAQILGIEISLFVFACGTAAVKLSKKNELISFSTMSNWVYEIPLSTWVVAGFFLTYLAFFVSPMFFGRVPRIFYFNKYLPDMYPIGFDLKFLVDLIKQWMEGGQTPFHITAYPPFTYIFFSPLSLIHNPNTLYKIVSLITIGSFIIAGLIIPLLIFKKSSHLILLLAATGLVSYGMQFELERGQFNVITIMLVMIAIYIYHYHHEYRAYAYIIFTAAVQLKIYPVIFVVLFIKDWQDWKGNLRRLAIFGSANFALLFIMGWNAFNEFLLKVSEQLQKPTLAWEGNHSIRSFFSEFITTNGYGIASPQIVDVVTRYNETIINLFLLLFLLCFFDILLQVSRQNTKLLNSHLLLTATIGALIIPVSNDYTLPILAGPMALAFAYFTQKNYGKKQIAAAGLLAISAVSYSSILYPFKYRITFLQNVFPFLFIILFAFTILGRLANSDKDTTSSKTPII